METRMKQILYLVFSLLIASCNLPEAEMLSTPASAMTATNTPPFDEILPSPTLTETSIPPTMTVTPTPCDPLLTGYCISNGHFLFQRPIRTPDHDSIDLTYAYASTSNGKRDPHHGVEYQNPFGTPVFAAGDGTVVYAGEDKTIKFSPWTNFYGNVIIIQHEGEMFTLYAHLSEILVQAGVNVRAGDEIGKVGQTGGATGSHLHFEVRQGSNYMDYFTTQNPELWTSPSQGTGALSITLLTKEERNYERPLVVTRFAEGSDDVLFTYYITSYTKGFEYNAEDAVLSNLPPGRYKVAFADISGLKERIVFIEIGKLTEVVFDFK
jgi:murein DD-endopeptidase MepM/ murein hydrolase activator NlpD